MAVQNEEKNSLTDYPLNLFGNDPMIEGIASYQKENLIFITTGGLRCLLIGMQLISEKGDLPSIIIVDNSQNVIQFWMDLKAMVADLTSPTASIFLSALKQLFIQNNYLSTDVYYDEDKQQLSGEYLLETLNPYLKPLFIDNFIQLIKSLTMLALDWSSTGTYPIIKKQIENTLNGSVIIYPSNIIPCLHQMDVLYRTNQVTNALEGIASLNPDVVFHVSGCQSGEKRIVQIVKGNDNHLIEKVKTQVLPQGKQGKVERLSDLFLLFKKIQESNVLLSNVVETKHAV
jgi:hypothetical protein